MTEFSDDEPNEEDLFADLEEFGKDLESSLEHKKNLRIAREREEEEEREEMERLRNLTTDDKKEEDSSQPKRVLFPSFFSLLLTFFRSLKEQLLSHILTALKSAKRR